jgi:hypothetical protein
MFRDARTASQIFHVVCRPASVATTLVTHASEYQRHKNLA